MNAVRPACPAVVRLLVAAGALACASSTLAGAETQPETVESSVPAAVETVHEDVSDRAVAHWAQLRVLSGKGDRKTAEQVARELLDILHEEGVQRLSALAAAAVLQGRRELAHGSAQLATESFQLAHQLDPKLAAAWWGEAQARYASGEGVLAAGKVAAEGVVVRLGSFWVVYGRVVEFAVLLLLALLVAGAAAVATLLVAHGPALAHLVEERLPADWHPTWRRGVGWALVLSPAAVQWLGAFALLPCAVGLAPVARRRERALIAAWLITLAVSVPLFGALWALSSVPANPGARAAVDSVERAAAPDLLNELTVLAGKHPRDATWKLLSAQVIARRQPEAAMHLLREGTELAPDDPSLRIALANIYYRSGKREAAGVLYREALRDDPQNVTAMFNLSRVRAATLQFKQADELLADARRLSADRVDALQRQYGADGVADPDVSAGSIGRHLVETDALPAVREALTPHNAVTVAALAALLGALVLRFRTGGSSARRCARCGAAFCVRCAGDEPDAETCLPCSQLFARREGLAPVARQEQARRVDRWIRRVGRGRAITQLVWPGLALIHEGRTWMGFLEATLWAFLVLGALTTDRLLPAPDLMPLWTPGLGFAAVAALFWLAVQLPALRPAPVARRGR